MKYVFNVARIIAGGTRSEHCCRVEASGIPSIHTMGVQREFLGQLQKSFPKGEYKITLSKRQEVGTEIDLITPANTVLNQCPIIQRHDEIFSIRPDTLTKEQEKAVYFLTKDGGKLCLESVLEELNKDPYLFDDEHDPQWFIIGWDILGEGDEEDQVFCDHSGQLITPAKES